LEKVEAKSVVFKRWVFDKILAVAGKDAFFNQFEFSQAIEKDKFFKGLLKNGV